MPPTLEVHLVSKGAEVTLASTRFTNDSPRIERMLVVNRAERFEPSKGERLRGYGVPQRAVLVLLLRAYSDGLITTKLSSESSPELTRSLFRVFRKQLANKSQPWLYFLVGISPPAELSEWFRGGGTESPGGSCWVGIGPQWRKANVQFVVKKDGARVPVCDYLRLSEAIERIVPQDKAPDPISIEGFEMLIWSQAMGVFSRGCGDVKHGDKVQILVSTNRPVHFYVLWLDESRRVVTVHPWNASNWESVSHDEAVSSLEIPRPNNSCMMRVEGPAGVESIIVLASEEVQTRSDLRRLRLICDGLRLGRRWPKPEFLVTARFGRTMPALRPTRTIKRIEVPHDVTAFQEQLAKNFTPHFDQVLICTFSNLGRAS